MRAVSALFSAALRYYADIKAAPAAVMFKLN